MKYTLKKDGKYTYLESGEGTPLIILHGLMGNLSNFDGVFDYFSNLGYKVIMPDLPLYVLPLLKTNVKYLSKFLKNFVKHKGIDKYILLGNSLGGHIALYHTKLNPKNVSGIVLTGSSGLYESAMGESYPKRSDYEYIKKKTQDVFYNPEIATKKVVDEVFETLNNR
ncbi:MAG: alpha/beta fold hydrolase, partial [Flavobacteriaceae bacterium]|nr:alpha/beta fold hydrolase [Flavobacteriaceae bacterium]